MYVNISLDHAMFKTEKTIWHVRLANNEIKYNAIAQFFDFTIISTDRNLLEQDVINTVA